MTRQSTLRPFLGIATCLLLIVSGGAFAHDSQRMAIHRSYHEMPLSADVLRFTFICPDGMQLEGRWIAEDVGQIASKDFLIGSARIVTQGPLNTFSLSRPNNGWPHGIYRLEVLNHGNRMHVERYVIGEVSESGSLFAADSLAD